MNAKERSRLESVEWLRARIKPGDTIQCVLESRARSGMSRVINFYRAEPDGAMTYLTGHIAAVLDSSRTKAGGMRVPGCGMDAGFHVVHSLSYRLFPESFVCIGERCPANDHNNGDRDYSPHQHEPGAAGYALRHNWL